MEKRPGFSLIEMSVVLLILAILAGAVVLGIRGPMTNAEMADVVAAIDQFDHLSRTYARENDRSVCLVLDMDEGAIRRMGEGVEESLGRPLALPSSYRISRMLVGKSGYDGGKVSVPVSRKGLSSSYAFFLSGPEGRKTWVLVAGLTGQMTVVEHEEEAKNILCGDDGRNAG